MDQKTNVLVGVIAVLLLAVVYLMFQGSPIPAEQAMIQEDEVMEEDKMMEEEVDYMKHQAPMPLTEQQTEQINLAKEDHSPKVLEFDVTAGSFYFLPNEIKVKEGDTVRIKLNNVGGTHDFTLDEFDVQTKKTTGGESDTVEFTADKKGTFIYYCSVGNGWHRMQGQIGVLTVE